MLFCVVSPKRFNVCIRALSRETRCTEDSTKSTDRGGCCSGWQLILHESWVNQPSHDMSWFHKTSITKIGWKELWWLRYLKHTYDICGKLKTVTNRTSGVTNLYKRQSLRFVESDETLLVVADIRLRTRFIYNLQPAKLCNNIMFWHLMTQTTQTLLSCFLPKAQDPHSLSGWKWLITAVAVWKRWDLLVLNKYTTASSTSVMAITWSCGTISTCEGIQPHLTLAVFPVLPRLGLWKAPKSLVQGSFTWFF